MGCGCFCHLGGHKVHQGEEGAGSCCGCAPAAHVIRTVWPPEGQAPERSPLAPSLPAAPIAAERAEAMRGKRDV